MSDYIPIDCNFYDELVLLAMHKTRITFVPNTYDVEEGDFIADLVTEPSKEEFMVMKSGIKIRLDAIASVSDNLVFLRLEEEELERI
jgi:transcriptional antiterminator Rof (Rho-off)